MSKVKTRNEIKAEMDDMAAQLESKDAAHAEEKQALEASITDLQGQLDAANAAKADLEGQLAKAKETNIGTLEQLKAEEKAKDEVVKAKDELQKENTRLQGALADPAQLDASMVPTAVNQKLEDAEADHQEANAKEPEDTAPKSELEIYESMEAGTERQAYWQKNKRAIIKQINARELKDD